MAHVFHLPDIGEGLTEATIVRWAVELGDRVDRDAPLVEMETDKAVVEIPAPHAGSVLYLGGAAGDTIAVGDVLAVVGEPDEEWSPSEAPVAAAPIVGNLAEDDAEVVVPVSSVVIDPESPGVQALPLVRRLAATLGVDLRSVSGSGPGGRVTRDDVEAAAAATATGERVRMSPTRLAITRNLRRSWTEIPHVTTYGEADATSVLEERRAQAGAAPPLEAVVIARLVPVLDRHRDFAAFVDGDDVVYRDGLDVGFAVDTPNGLMVAVVRDVRDKSVDDIAADVLRLAGAARDRTIAAADMRGAAFTISNIGAVGGRYGTPIIPWGTAAILSIGRADPRPVVRDGEVVVGREFPLSLSYDHRLIDGAAGRAFLADVIEALEG